MNNSNIEFGIWKLEIRNWDFYDFRFSIFDFGLANEFSAAVGVAPSTNHCQLTRKLSFISTVSFINC